MSCLAEPSHPTTANVPASPLGVALTECQALDDPSYSDCLPGERPLLTMYEECRLVLVP